MTLGTAIAVFALSCAAIAFCAVNRRAAGGALWLYGLLLFSVLAAASVAYAALGAVLVSGIR